jgi:hypothetical protein
METGKKAKIIWQSSKTGILWLITNVVVPSFVAFITANYIQPWITRPQHNVLGALPIHFYEEKQDLFPGKTSRDKTHNHRLAVILKVKNPSWYHHS